MYALTRVSIRIRLVESPSDQMVARGLLGKLGYNIYVAGDGEQGLKPIMTCEYDLVLMDCHMPNLDGFETTKRILAHYQQSGEDRLRIVAITASTMKEDVGRCRLSVRVNLTTKRPGPDLDLDFPRPCS